MHPCDGCLGRSGRCVLVEWGLGNSLHKWRAYNRATQYRGAVVVGIQVRMHRNQDHKALQFFDMYNCGGSQK